MMRKRRGCLRGLAALGLLAVLLGIAGCWFVRRPWPQVDGTITVAGLSAPVEVVRDRWGVPHLYARNERDLFFAQGFVHAQDRLWQMEMNRRIARGELSAILGEATLDVDRAMLTIGVLRAAEADWQRMAAEPRAVLEAYAAGVNAFIETHRDQLPVEFTLLGVDPAPWRPVDSLAWGKVMCWNLGENFNFEVSRARIIGTVGREAAAQLLPPFRGEGPVVIPDGVGDYAWMREARFDRLAAVAAFFSDRGPDWGSNNWAIHGSRTATGRPLLGNDTHLPLTMPSVWYANGLHGGRFQSLGYTLPGVPMVLLGHNGRIAWGITDMIPDVQDFYIEKVDDKERPRQYLFRGEWRDIRVLPLEIAVRGREPERLELLLTHHGPVMNQASGRLRTAATEIYTLRWAAAEPGDLLESVFRLNLAGDWNAFRQALRLWDAPNLNFVYADTAGNIGYQATGDIPVRVPGHQGVLPVPGWTGEYEWQGFIPFEELPTLYNPPSGFVTTANNKVVGDGYPYHLAYEWADPYRAARLTRLLSENRKVTMDDMRDLQADTYSLPAEEMLPVLLTVEPEGGLERQALAMLRAWNRRNDAEGEGAAGAAVFQAWYRSLLRQTFGDELGPELTREYLIYDWKHMPMMADLLRAGESRWFDDGATPAVERRADILARSLGEAVRTLSGQMGDDPARWSWGELHTTAFVHRPIGESGLPVVSGLFNGDRIAAPGDRFSVNSVWFSFNPDRPFEADGGAAHRFLADLSDLDNSRGAQNSGQSGHLFHPHREDLVPLWQSVGHHPLPYSRERVRAAAEATLELRPR